VKALELLPQLVLARLVGGLLGGPLVLVRLDGLLGQLGAERRGVVIEEAEVRTVRTVRTVRQGAERVNVRRRGHCAMVSHFLNALAEAKPERHRLPLIP
jgi:hypothetical protein